jgi:FG-GAP-like repeat/Abnormal spindle-like microcephaly-assoc'd, ASPM-SPD-2-Hydin/FG-GAP repeat
VVNWNGSARATTFVNQSQLTAAISAADIATASTAWVTVVNPAPGGGTSNVAFFTTTTDTGGSVTFGSASSVATGQSPISVAVGDFNGDGNLDLAVANFYDKAVSILLGDGTGHFTLAYSLAVGENPVSVEVGDFNGDGKLDLAVANVGDSTVSILLGDGTGNFTLASSPASGGGAYSVEVGDFNGDGKLDLAVVNVNYATVSILLGDGTGHFTLALSPVVGSLPVSVVVGDFNGDGKLDLAVANQNSNTVSILLGDGTGHFTLASSPATGNNPHSAAVGDFNGDGKLDLAVVNEGESTVILLGDGTGHFTLVSPPAAGVRPSSVAAGDFNGDGKLDLAVASYAEYPNTPGTVSILLGDGTGHFTLASSPAVGDLPLSVAVGDFNRDGKLDVVTANSQDNTVSVLVQVPPPSEVTLSPTSLNFGSQNVGTSSAPQVATLTNNTSGSVTITGISITGGDSGDYSETNDCGTSLAAGGSCSISVTFKPTAIGTRSGTLQATDSDPSSPQTTSLTGVGTQGPPAVTLSPTSLMFSWQPINTSSAPSPVTLTNTGTGTLSITSFAV